MAMMPKIARLSLSRLRGGSGKLTSAGALEKVKFQGRRLGIAPVVGQIVPGKAVSRRDLYARKPELKPTGGGSLWKTFLVFVALPTTCAFIYFAFIQTPQFITESRFVVRSASESKGAGLTDTLSVLSKLGGSAGGKSTAQDGFIATDYVRGRAIVQDIGGRAFMEQIFARATIDNVSRLKTDAPLEELWKYWNKHVSASLDTISGVVTLQVSAFTPEDALKVNEQILELCEKLVNSISQRSRKDAVNRAEGEMAQALQKLLEAKQQLLEYRNRNVLIDPVIKATSLGEIIAKLTVKRIEIENNLSSLAGSLSNDSPSQRLLATQLSVIDKQIAEQKQQLTGNADSPRVSAEIAEFEQLKLSEFFAQRLYQISQADYEKSRQQAEKQQLYVGTIIRPLMPGEPLIPKVGIYTFLCFALLLIIWAVVTLLISSVREHIE